MIANKGLVVHVVENVRIRSVPVDLLHVCRIDVIQGSDELIRLAVVKLVTSPAELPSKSMGMRATAPADRLVPLRYELRPS